MADLYSGGSPYFNEQQGGGYNFDAMELARKQANKALHSARNPRDRRVAATNLAGLRNQIGQARSSQGMGYNETRSPDQIYRQGGTPNVKRINPGQQNGQQGGQTTGPGDGETGGSIGQNLANNPNNGGNMFGGSMFPNNGDPSSMLNSIFGAATNGSIQSFNTSANRLRERLDSQTRGLQQQAMGRNLGRGFGASGAQDADQFRVDQAGQQAYANGLDDLSNQFEQNRLKGLDTASNAANGLFRGQIDRESMANSLLNNREQRTSTEGIANNQIASSDRQNQLDNSTRGNIATQGTQASIWNAIFGAGANKDPSIVNVPGGSAYGTGGSVLPMPGQSTGSLPMYNIPSLDTSILGGNRILGG